MKELDKVQNFESPLDKVKVLQTIANPRNPDEFIVVKHVTRNVHLMSGTTELGEGFKVRSNEFNTGKEHEQMVKKTVRH